MPTIAVKKIPQDFDLGFRGHRFHKIATSYGLAQQILGGLLQNIRLPSFIFGRSKVISFCQVTLLSLNDDGRRQMNRSLFLPLDSRPQTRGIATLVCR
jgi:hypothetical protein